MNTEREAQKMQHFVIKCCILAFTNNIGTWENYFIGKLKFFNLVFFNLICLAISNLIQILFFLPVESRLFGRYNLCQPKSSLDTCLNLFDQRRITFQKPADIFAGDTASQHIGNDGPDLSFTVLLF